MKPIPNGGGGKEQLKGQLLNSQSAAYFCQTAVLLFYIAFFDLVKSLSEYTFFLLLEQSGKIVDEQDHDTMG